MGKGGKLQNQFLDFCHGAGQGKRGLILEEELPYRSTSSPLSFSIGNEQELLRFRRRALWMWVLTVLVL